MAKPLASIHKRGDALKGEDVYTYYPVVIIGAGESGIAMGCRLKEKLGCDQFRIFDRQAGLGGTWWANIYPGIACDVPAIFYSFSFCQNKRWNTLLPSGAHIFEYLSGVCEKYQIVDKIQVNTDVRGVRWLEDAQEWEVYLVHLLPGMGDLTERDRQARIAANGEESVYAMKETVRAKVVVSAVGGLVEPNVWPKEIPGSETFEGEILHSARWDPKIDLHGKDVVVIGTGCSAAQIVPQLTKPHIGAKTVTQLMRTPPWIMPNAMNAEELAWWEKWSPTLFSNIPGFQQFCRTLLFVVMEKDFFLLFQDTPWGRSQRRKREKQSVNYMKGVAPKKYHEILTPNYGLGCKRRVLEGEWLRCLHQPNIDLTTKPLKSIQPKGITLGPGRHYPPVTKEDGDVSPETVELPADVIILSNGYQTKSYLHPLRVYGRGGRELQDVWHERGGAQAYMGVSMDGFPNFFTIFGPNTATGHSSVILASEGSVEYSLNFIKPILEGDIDTYEVKESAQRHWTDDIQSALRDSVWASGGCKSWYRTENGWNATVYPYSQLHFAWRCMFPTWSDWTPAFTSKGLRKRRTRNLLRFCTALGVIISVASLRRSGYSLPGLKDLLKENTRQTLIAAQGYVSEGVQSLLQRL
ncbi:hypothetical protein FQN54_007295 [Arachnomyces sp. PD_36]|nr:hypothetical protein FQN54_007295 [Arachnomyces sp. PD_36]